MVTPLVKHKIVKKRTARFTRYQADRKVTVKVGDEFAWCLCRHSRRRLSPLPGRAEATWKADGGRHPGNRGFVEKRGEFFFRVFLQDRNPGSSPAGRGLHLCDFALPVWLPAAASPRRGAGECIAVGFA